MKFFMKNNFLICISLTRVFIINFLCGIETRTCDFPHVSCATIHANIYATRFSFQKKNLFIYFWLIWLIPTTNLSFIFLFFFSHHIWKPERKAKAKINDWYVYFHYFSHQGWEKLLEISHTCVKNYMHTRVWSLFHVAITIITESYNQHLCYLMETFISFILFLPFPRLYKAELTWSLNDTMMRLKISGGG